MKALNFFILWDFFFFFFLVDNLKITTMEGGRDLNPSFPSKEE